jgi:hypothetical protein
VGEEREGGGWDKWEKRGRNQGGRKERKRMEWEEINFNLFKNLLCLTFLCVLPQIQIA